jgi:hypothetical protein
MQRNGWKMTFQLVQLGDSGLVARDEDHYVNATELCKAISVLTYPVKKEYKNWKKNPETSVFIEELVESLYIGLFKEKNKNTLQKVLSTLSNQGRLSTVLVGADGTETKSNGSTIGNQENLNDDDHESSPVNQVSTSGVFINGRLYGSKLIKDIITTNCMIYENRGNNDKGTWVHPRIAINIAEWGHPKFAAQVTDWIEDLFIHGYVQLKASEVIGLQIELDKSRLQVNDIKRETGTLRDQLSITEFRASEMEKKVNEVKRELKSKARRVVPEVVDPQLEENVILIRVSSEREYRITHCQNRCFNRTLRGGEEIKKYPLRSSGVKEVALMRDYSTGTTKKVPDDGFHMCGFKVELGKNYTEQQLLALFNQLYGPRFHPETA